MNPTDHPIFYRLTPPPSESRRAAEVDDSQPKKILWRLFGYALATTTVVTSCLLFWPIMRWGVVIVLAFWFVTIPLAWVGCGYIARDLARLSHWRPIATRLDRWALAPTPRAPGITWRDLLVTARNLLLAAIVLSPIVIFVALFLWRLFGDTHHNPYEGATDVEHCLGCP